MARKTNNSKPLHLPSREWSRRMGMVLLATLAIAMLVMGKGGNPAIMKFRNAMTDIIAPVLSAAASPINAIEDGKAWVHDMLSLRDENLALKAQNAELLQWQEAAKSMEAENQSLHKLLNVVPSQKTTFVTARIVSDLGGPYVRSALINGGADQGVKKDEAVVNENGLVGRVIDAGATSARVLLLSDINSRVPVMTERTRDKGILIGNNEALPSLSYLPEGNNVAIGDRIITSGDGGIFPKGIAVGVVTGVGKSGVKVQLLADPAKVEYVNIINFSL